MSPQYWQQYLDSRLTLTSQTLSAKATEYASNGDRMHNFNRAYVASAGRARHREDTMWGMALKHWVSIMDMIDSLANGTLPKEGVVKEKFGDMINYLMLMEGSILHKIDTLNGCTLEPTCEPKDPKKTSLAEALNPEDYGKEEQTEIQKELAKAEGMVKLLKHHMSRGTE